MTIQYSTSVRNDKLNELEASIGPNAKLQIFTGAKPSSCAAADTGTQLADLSLPSDWMLAASGGVKGKQGTWQGTASAGGTAGHFRLKDSTGATCHIQGSVTGIGGGGDMTLDNPSINSGQTIVINSFNITAGNA